MKRTPTLITRAAVLAALAGTIILFVAWTNGRVPMASAHHGIHDLDGARGPGLPGGQNDWFMGSGVCEGCHGHDNTAFASVNSLGEDVNVVDDWRSTMMANSAHDPFWRAKVSHEILVNPGHQAELEDKCTSCHAPQGHFNKHLTGQGMYTLAELDQDPVGADGVSCIVCHRQSPDSIGLLNSGNLKFDTNLVLYGPYSNNIFGAPMTSFVGFEPQYGAHINDAGLCSGCHTLITETVDLAGAFTGDHFVEQATYHEWVNSAFNNEVDTVNGITCQGCHIPRIDDAVVISANYLFLQGRSPFGMHHLAGGNAFMLNILKDNIGDLGLTANETRFDSTIARTLRNLQQQSLLLDASLETRTWDTAYIDVKLTNLTGHKFPSGYPSRRAFVELIVFDANNDTLFKSGRFDSNNEVEYHPSTYAPHYDVIDSPTEAQIYEMVMSDVNGNKTTVLQRAKEPLKDNRLCPLGFSTSHYTYDTTLIAGVPASDIDFDRDDLGAEGSGTDIVHYRVPMDHYAGLMHVQARVWYQSVPPLWNEEMFSYSSAQIDSFRTMYDQADGTPILVVTDTLSDLSVGIDDLEDLGVQVFPNPVHDGLLTITGLSEKVSTIEVFDSRGRLVARTEVVGRALWRTRLPDGPGTYFVTFRGAGRTFVQKIASY